MEETEKSNFLVDEKEECPLDVFTPDMIIENLSKKDECTEDLKELIKQVQPNAPKLKKLSKIFTSLTNCDHTSISEITKSKNRSIRLVSTFLIFSKMCDWCKNGQDYETVSNLYREVFLVRYRDVDPNIRALCAEFIADWITISPTVFCTNTYLKYLGLYINDKSDNVRKKALASLIKLVEKKLDVEETIEKNIKRIVEISIMDKNSHIREEAQNLILISFNYSFITKEFVYQTLKGSREKTKDEKLLNLTLWNILKYGNEGGNLKTYKRRNYNFKDESICGYYEELHELYTETSSEIIRRLIFDRQDLDHLVQFTIQTHEETEGCCEKKKCYLEILSALKIEEVGQALRLFDNFKDSVRDVEIIFKMINDLNSFKNEVENTIRLVESLFDFVYSYRSRNEARNSLDHFFLILKSLEADFQSTVNIFIEQAQRDIHLKFYAIRSFDLSSFVIEEDYVETKIFASLWGTINKDYHFVENLNLFQHLDLREVCELLFFINSKLGGCCEDYKDVCYDPESSLKSIHTKIRIYLKENITDLVKPENVLYFFRFNEENVMGELVHLIFFFIDPSTLINLFGKSKNKSNLVEEYFVFLDKYYEIIGGDGRFNLSTTLVNEKENQGNSTLNLISELEDCTIKGSVLNAFSNIGESLLIRSSEVDRSYHKKEPVEINLKDVALSGENIFEFSKILSSRGKLLKEGLIFKILKKIIEQKYEKLYDTVCINFISHLNSNESIVLDSKINIKCKLKTLLSKKSRGPIASSLMSDNTTYL